MMCYDAIKLSHGENQSNLNLPSQNYYKKLMIFRQKLWKIPTISKYIVMYRLRYCTIYNPPTLGEILISNQINSKVGVPAPLLYDIVNNGIQITDPVYIQGNGFTDILKNVWNWFKPRSESIIAAAKEVIPKAVNFGKKVYESYKKKKGDPHDLFQVLQLMLSKKSVNSPKKIKKYVKLNDSKNLSRKNKNQKSSDNNLFQLMKITKNNNKSQTEQLKIAPNLTLRQFKP
ncbi:hypothetical protein PAPYR_12221 [Paratrimastix pyriformis]|uniref:Uncharacterized protein n=1 Tax=Paratrimastix pyriformis TaxID=342808 RepID=A0ABQ8U7L5_9EUKA|nr:hypothetical protein PAPYR_12221 [Paratrimastix pyriformis]